MVHLLRKNLRVIFLEKFIALTLKSVVLENNSINNTKSFV
jgi:hypothetical protein